MTDATAVSGGAAPLELPIPRADFSRRLGRLTRTAILWAAGTMPVLAIPLFVFDVRPMTASFRYLVLLFTSATFIIMLGRSAEAAWAWYGFVAGLVGVAAYDAVRMPLVAANIWPDFIPRLGGWVVGRGSADPLVGYVWRILGDGGGISMAFFAACCTATTTRAAAGMPAAAVIRRQPVPSAVRHGIFIWSGLMVTVTLAERGADMLFTLTPAAFGLSLFGHLV